MSSKKNANGKLYNFFSKIAKYLNNQIVQLNQSKLFAGLIIIILNVSSKYVNLKLSKTVESYLKHTFNRDILVFAMSWMGTRDIYIAFMITICFIICIDYIFNEDSQFCCLPEHFTGYHVSLLDSSKNGLSPDEIKKVEEVLDKAKNMNKSLEPGNLNGVNKMPDGTEQIYNIR
jgi:hypothetical protein